MDLAEIGFVCAFAVGSAFVPFLSIEVLLVARGSTHAGPELWVLALAAAVGQMIGKTVFFYAGKGARIFGSKKIDEAHKKAHEEPSKPRRWQRIVDVGELHPAFGAGVTFLSASIGIPPFAIMSVVAGAWKMRLVTFLAVGISGRFIRFLTVILAPEVIKSLEIF